MRKYLAKRRWQRWFNTVKAMNRMQRLGRGATGGGGVGEGAEHAANLLAAEAEAEIGMTPEKRDPERWV
ncbi:MAG: hypothetical protein AAF471_09285 [Myxococcota bacterium]